MPAWSPKFARVHWGPRLRLMHRVCKITNFVKTWGRDTKPRLGHFDARTDGDVWCRAPGRVSNAQRRRPPTLQKLEISDSVWWTLDVWVCANIIVVTTLLVGQFFKIIASDWFVCWTHLYFVVGCKCWIVCKTSNNLEKAGGNQHGIMTITTRQFL